jgi:hypothetical protein
MSTAQERAKDVIIQYRESGLTVLLEDLITTAIQQAEARGLREVAAQCREGFITMAGAATLLESRAMGFEQLVIIEAWCEAKAKEREG